LHEKVKAQIEKEMKGDTCTNETSKKQEEEEHEGIKIRNTTMKQKEKIKKHFEGAKTKGRRNKKNKTSKALKSRSNMREEENWRKVT